MSEREIMELILAEEPPAPECALGDLVAPYVSLLATLSDKISRDELAELISFGAVLLQNSLEEFRADIHARALSKPGQERLARGRA